MNIQDFRNQLDSANNVLIILPYLVDTDAISTAAQLYTLVSSSSKRVAIASSNPISVEYTEIFHKADIQDSSIARDIEPVSYVVSVGGVEGKVNVSWNRKDNNVDLVLIPERGEIDFSKVTTSRQGGTYDLVLVVNSTKGEHLGKIYNDHKGLFAGFNLVSIGKSFTLEESERPSLQFEGYSSTCEMIFDNFEELGGNPDQSLAEITAWGMIGKTDGLQVTKSSKTFDVLSIISNRFNVDLNQIFRNYYASFSKDELFVTERVIRNIKVDESRKTIYSIMTTADFNGLNYNPNSFDPVKYLTKNVKGNYQYSFIAFEKSLNHTIVYIKALTPESDIAEIAEKLGAYPDTNAAIVTVSTSANQAVNDVLRTISGDKVETEVINDAEIIPTQTEATVMSEEQEQKTESVEALAENSPVEENPVPEESSMREEVTQAPFVRATNIAVDPEAKPAKEQSYYSGTNKPFDTAVK